MSKPKKKNNKKNPWLAGKHNDGPPLLGKSLFSSKTEKRRSIKLRRRSTTESTAVGITAKCIVALRTRSKQPPSQMCHSEPESFKEWQKEVSRSSGSPSLTFPAACPLSSPLYRASFAVSAFGHFWPEHNKSHVPV